MRTRRRFTAEFKKTAVQWLASRPVAEVARLCDVSVSVVHRWRRKLGEYSVRPAQGRRRFSKQFKASALERLERERGASRRARQGLGPSIAQVAAAVGVRPNTLHRWRKEAREFGGQAFSGYGKTRAASEPGRAIKVSLHPGEYQRVRAAFEKSSARSLPDFTRSQLLGSTGEHHVDHDVEQAYAEIHSKLDDLAGILRRMAWVYAAARDSRSPADHSRSTPSLVE